MPIYLQTDFRGHWPVGTAAIVAANTPERAAQLLEAALDLRGLVQIIPPESLIPLSSKQEFVEILCDGDY
ncbi:hypothetical protein ACOTJF_18080 [Achromobacter ruhlandii]|uniref:hypothetical protein n=1 Tax=Achromobacter ruhlandii TaxID=72557 RepID=UPI003B9FB444